MNWRRIYYQTRWWIYKNEEAVIIGLFVIITSLSYMALFGGR